MSNLHSMLDDISSVRAVELSDDEIDAGLVDAERVINRLRARQAELIAAAESRGFYETLGFGSVTSWVRSRLNIRHGVARMLVTLGRALRRMPKIRVAFEQGAVSPWRVEALAAAERIAPEVFREAEQALVDAAVDLAPAAFRSAVEYWRQAADPIRFEADAGMHFERRSLSVSTTWEGMTRLDGWLDPESGAVVRTALEAYADAAGRDATDTRSRGQCRADALVDIARLSLEHGDLPVTGGFRPQIVLTVDLQTLEQRAGYRADLEGGGRLTPAAARRLACDAGLTRIIVDTDSRPLDVGRTRRTATPAQRRALAVRDGGCVIDGCDAPAKYTDAHHIEHWVEHDGSTDIDWLALVCRRHHTLLHAGKVQLPARFVGGDP